MDKKLILIDIISLAIVSNILSNLKIYCSFICVATDFSSID